MWMQNDRKLTKCSKCGEKFLGDYGKLGMAFGWHKLCKKCWKEKNKEKK